MTHPSEEGSPPARDRKADADPQDEAWERYWASCADYIKRQLIVYQNWPQRRWEATGYRKEKVFSDLNN
ncbi:MAG TPA: hypothetical protein VGR28_00870 [Candidatus Thermoplasmatota archaeon]|nr:hypothetical protein [Candidatus Thermoplasmatota archaeon]